MFEKEIKNIRICLIILLILLFVVSFLLPKVSRIYTPREVSESMEPTINTNDVIALDKNAYTDVNEQVKRMDIVGFRFEINGEEMLFVKRVVGIPGDVIEIKNYYTYINGVKYCGGARIKNETAFTVPNGMFYFIGDNVCNSYDSRFVGCVEMTRIVGKVSYRIFPFSNSGIISAPDWVKIKDKEIKKQRLNENVNSTCKPPSKLLY